MFHSIPPLSVVGLSEQEASEEAKGDILVFTSSFNPMKNSISKWVSWISWNHTRDIFFFAHLTGFTLWALTCIFSFKMSSFLFSLVMCSPFMFPRRQEKTVMKLVVDAESDRVLGASMCGPDAAEIMQVSIYKFFCYFLNIVFLVPLPLLHSWFWLSFGMIQGIAVALKCGATKANFDSTVCLFKERSSCTKAAVNI